jgi:two-component system, OmpR family, response regulator
MTPTDTKPPSPAHILVVDDDPAVRELLRECFELDGYKVSEASNGKDLAAHMAAGTVHLITLDIGLGGENGFDIARQVRAGANVPIVMITGKGDMVDRVVGLELGADDYITKPFHVREVQARVRAVLRRYEVGLAVRPAGADATAGQAGERLAFGGWILDLQRRELVSEAGARQELTTAEFNMLEMFLRRPSRVLSRDNIMDLLKGHEWSPFDRSIDSLIVRLRRKIEPEPDTPRLVKTVRGVGYVLAVDVRKC